MKILAELHLKGDAKESQHLVNFARNRISSICAVMSAGPRKLTEPTNYENFMNLEYDATDNFKYLVAHKNFTEAQVYFLNRYIMETFLCDKTDTWDITERGQVLINVARHLCFLYANEKLLL